MKCKLESEDQILELGFRKKVIAEIIDTENVDRKLESLKRYELYKGLIKKWIIEQLTKEGLQEETLVMMSNRAATVPILSKAVNKLARCYNAGVVRTSEEAQEQLDALSSLLEVDQRQKIKDRYRQLFKNCVTYVKPEKDDTDYDGSEVYKLRLKVLAPYQYDVIEDCYDHERPKIFILTDFIEQNRYNNRTYAPEGTDGRGIPGQRVSMVGGSDRKDQIIADNREDQGVDCRTFIWWCDKYHFTTDQNGEIIKEKSPEDLINPIGKKPFINMGDNQDGEFWAQGGDDLVNASVLINTLLTDLFSIAFIQGWGQMVVTGRDIPQHLNVGPRTALILNYDEGDPEPKVDFASANPPLDSWMKMIEQYTAITLSTNDISPSSVAGKLEASNAASGIALLIEHSEATNSIEDKQRMFKDDEKLLWDIIFRWQNYLFDKQVLSQEHSEIGKIPETATIDIKFNSYSQILSEAERLDNIKKRKELGINTLIDLIRIDNPELTEEQAEEKLQKIMEEKVSNVQSMIAKSIIESEQKQNPQMTPEDNTKDMEHEMEDNGNEEQPF